MEKLLDFTKNLFLDVFASVRGFLYGFIVFGLSIGVMGVLIYMALYVRNMIGNQWSEMI